MKSIQDLLGDFEKEYGLQSKALDIRALEVFLELQNQDKHLANILALGVHKGVLLLRVQNSMESFQLMMKKTSLLNQVNQLCGQEILKDIQVENTNH